MDSDQWKSMSPDELWDLYEELTPKLAHKIAAEKARLEERLHKIQSAHNHIRLERLGRPHRKVPPKYRNPKNPAEVWSGRGKLPRWLTAELRTGKKLDDFLISRSAIPRRREA